MRQIRQLLYDQYLAFRYISGKTKLYYPGRKKSKFRIFRDLLIWQLNEHEFNSMYYAMGLHLRGWAQKDYLGRSNFLRIKCKAEKRLRQKAGCDDIQYDVITKDKFYANSIFTANQIPCLENLAMISFNELIYPDGTKKSIDTLVDLTFPFFIKNNTLESGEGVLYCKVVNNEIQVNGTQKTVHELWKILNNKKWVLQKKYASHRIIQTINSTALNSTRIYTILNNGHPEFLCGYQGFATGNSSSDSWKHGSVYVGIDPVHGTLKEFGLTSVSDKRDGILRTHPDSTIKFENFKIPYFKDAVELCIRAHSLFYFNFIIGWDVAITDSGPLLIEANENPGINVAQALNGGLKKVISEYAGKII